MEKSRKAAIEAREKHYKTGKPCKHGHISKRNTVDGCCVVCRSIASALQAQENKNIRAMLREVSD